MASWDDQSALSDWNLPLSFMKNRHKEKIEGIEKSENSWRMKDRVSTKNCRIHHILCPNIWLTPCVFVVYTVINYCINFYKGNVVVKCLIFVVMVMYGELRHFAPVIDEDGQCSPSTVPEHWS